MEGANPTHPPFYLSNPAKTRFVPTPSTPFSLGQQVAVFSKRLSQELKDLPKQLGKESGGTLSSFLGDQGHHLEEALEDVKKANAFLKRGGGDDDAGTSPTLTNAATSLRPLTWKPLELFDGRQLRSFSLMPFCPLFPPEENAPADQNLEELTLDKVGEGKEDKPKKGKVKPGKLSSNKCAVAVAVPRRGNGSHPQRPQAGAVKGRANVGEQVRKGTAVGLGNAVVAVESGRGPSGGGGGPSGTVRGVAGAVKGRSGGHSKAKRISSKKPSGKGRTAAGSPSSYEIESLEGLKLTIKLN